MTETKCSRDAFRDQLHELSGQPISKQRLTRLKRLTDQNTGISLSQIAPQFDVHFSTISRNLRAIGIAYRRKKRAPKYTD